MKPTQVDIAFDLSMAVTADEVAEALRPHFEAQRLTDGISGQAGVNTRYIGSISSERRIRIYRKDLETAAVAAIFGPTIRVELVLKGKHAVAWWDRWRDSEESGYQAAAAHIEQMTGLSLVESSAEIPHIEPVQAADPGQRLASLIAQYGCTLAAMTAAGIDIIGMAQEHCKNAGPVARSRAASLHRSIEEAGTAEVVALARQING